MLNYIRTSKAAGEKRLAILVDPDKVVDIQSLTKTLLQYPPDLILVGGSKVEKPVFDRVAAALHQANVCPIVIFPGDYQQVSNHSDAVLLLSLISGRNPEYLIGQHVKAARTLDAYPGEVIPTSYILLDGKNHTSVQEVSNTTPIPQDNLNLIIETVLAGKLLGHQLHYLEAGSGAHTPVETEIVKHVLEVTPHPVIVGGGIRNAETARQLWAAGADLLVVGNGFEENPLLLKEILNARLQADV